MDIYELSLYPIEDYGWVLSDEQTLPVSTNADSDETIDLLAGDGVYQNALMVLIDLAFTNGSSVTIKILQSENNSDWEADYITYELPADTYAKRIAIGLINPKRYIKLNYVTQENLTATITAQLSSWKVG